MKGQLFHIQRFSLDDGDGIRTMVFLKGCNQRCIWCHNPESLNREAELSRIDSLCTRCGRCAAVCPQQAVYFADGAFHTDPKKCVRCGKCLEQCPESALKIEGFEMEAEEVVRKICRDRIYYEESGGGVTFSGGEPTLQGEFLLELLERCRKEGISTAIETNGNTPSHLVEQLSPLLDTVLIDLKHADPEKHRAFTGADNRLTLEAIRYYAAHNRTEVRIPVIPSFNDTPEEIQAMLDLLAELGAKKAALLPYHTFGVSKYKNLDRPYQLAGIDKLEESDVAELLEKVKIPDCLQVEIHVK